MNHPLFPRKEIFAWQGGEEDPEFFPALPLQQLFRDEHDCDAYTTCYIVVDPEGVPMSQVPRLGKRCLPSIRAEGGQVWMRIVAVDLDRKPHVPWEKPEDAAEAMEALSPLLPHAALYVTRRGIRAVFKLQQLVAPEDFRKVALCAVKECKVALRRVASKTSLDLDDTCAEWTRLFGLPNVIRKGTNTAEFSDLQVPVPWAPWFPGSDAIRVVGSELEDRVSSYLPQDMPTERPEPGVAREMALSAVVAAPKKLKSALDKVLTGRRFYASGTRNADTYKLLAAFLDFCASRGVIPEPLQVYGLFYDSVSESTGTSPKEARAETWGMVQRAVVRAQAALEIELEGLETALAAALDRSRVPSVVYSNKTRWVWDSLLRMYGQPISDKDTFYAEVSKHHPIITFTEDDKPKGISSILRDNGTFVWKVRQLLGHTGSKLSYDSLGRAILEMGVAALPEVPAVFHQDCQDYLDTIINNSPSGDRFLDWLATSGDLSKATTALLMRGKASAGKTMLVEALSQLFGGKADFTKVMGNFNGLMLESALIHLEEGSDRKNGSVANRFREVVGGSSVAVERKGVDPVEVIGNYRMVITSNNPQPIPVENAKNLDDFRAIALRVLPIYFGYEPQGFLAALGGRPATEDWVQRDLGERKVPGLLVEHLSWIRENHEAKDYKDRFLVPAEVTNWHVQHLLQGVLRDVLFAVGMGLSLTEDDTVVAHEGRAWIQAEQHRAPRALSLVNRLSAGKYEHEEVLQAITVGLSDGDPKRIQNKTYYPMPTDVLLALMQPTNPDVFVEAAEAYNRAKAKLVA